MSSTNTTSGELSQILTEYCNRYMNISDSVKNPLTKVSEALRYELLSSITDSNGNTVLTIAAERGHTELCVTLLSYLSPADRLKLILVNKHAALHWSAYWGYTDTVSSILSCLTADQQLQLLFTQDKDGNTALHDAAWRGHTEPVKTVLDYLTPEQQLQLISVKNKKGMTASEEIAGYSTNSDIVRTLEKYQKEAEYRVNYLKFSFILIHSLAVLRNRR